MADAEGCQGAETFDHLNILSPVHSETLLFDGRLYSLVIIQDDTPRIEWTRQEGRSTY
jgi:hypothetical protein